MFSDGELAGQMASRRVVVRKQNVTNGPVESSTHIWTVMAALLDNDLRQLLQ